ncbi:hypothetical protein K461DRAFT_290621 [Myriangium duriaei CBS 260.36]|uniref:LsmAD domain-containing protein n=1 Tax=Myriangium duriaei CBS 260.36 TaxID=1168546 RepID=A0A9P4J9H5_9PEZI|nr:hypothetical protein K461DRAFT_290621 [Myriangium duriaei CBS 260.36]
MNGGTAALKSSRSSSKNSAGGQQSSTNKAQSGAMSPAKSSGDTRNQAATTSETHATGKSAGPKAWTTGTNPITQRNSALTTVNGLANGHGQMHQEQGKANVHESQSSDKHAHDRLMFLFSNFIGLDAALNLKNGERFLGVFSGASSQNGETRYHLKMVRKTTVSAPQQSDDTPQASPLVGEGEDFAMAFDMNDTVDLSVAGVNLGTSQARAANGSAFKTDTEISGNLDLRERVLQKWEPGPDEKVDLSLGNDTGYGQGGWDQFAANEKLYNVRSDYNEDLYTTTIDKSNPRYKQVAEQAERLAREIEGGANRSTVQADSGLDEEDKYSGVRREAPSLGKSGPNAYVPPSKRPITNQPTVSGAPFDPAIISSQLAKPDTPGPSKAGPSTDSTSAEKQDKDKTSTPETAPTNIKETVAKALASTAGANNVSNKGDIARGPSVAAPASKPSAEKGADIMRDVTDAFKQFNQSEKMRIQAQQRQQQAQRATTARQEKSVRLNDLKKFSQNFKLSSRVPEDLVPILAKSKEKQDEIIKRADQSVREQEEQKAVGGTPSPKGAKPEAQATQRTATPSETTVETAPQIGNRTRSQQQTGRGQNAAAQIPRAPSQANQRNQLPFRGTSAAAGPTPVSIPPPGGLAGTPTDGSVLSPTSATSMRFNAKAIEFKPNPSASTFTPTGPGSESGGSKRPSVISPPPPASSRPTPSTDFFTTSSRKSKFSEGTWEAVTSTCFAPTARLLNQTQGDDTKKAQYANNGGIPQGYRTAPVWDAPEANAEKSFVDFFPKSVHPPHSPLHASQNGSMPHQHQLPLHLQNGGPHVHQQSQFYRGQPHLNGPHHMDDQRMHFASAASSVQPSPRMVSQTMVFNGQGPPQMAAYPYAIPPSGMSPAMAMRSLPPGAQYMSAQGAPMGGHMMVQQPSNGPYNHLGQQQMQMYPSPVPSHVQPHFGGHNGQPGMPGGYGGSPRAHPMSHQGSQQGHAPQPMFMMPGQMVMMPHHGGSMAPMRGFNQSQFGGQHPQNSYAMQHRAMSNGGYSQHVTPRQQHAMPHPQPMGGAANAPTAANSEEGR